MFGTIKPDHRTLTEDGKILYDELASLTGFDNKEKAAAVTKQGGKSDLRDVGVVPRSGGCSTPRKKSG